MDHLTASPPRTQGDGMENVVEVATKIEALSITEPKQIKKSLVDNFLYRQSDVSQRSLPPPVIPGRIVSLTPNRCVPSRKEKLYNSGFQSKEPRFVPYEPYKAAVNPIIPIQRHKGSRKRLSSVPTSSSSVGSSNAATTEEATDKSTPGDSQSDNVVRMSLVASREEVVGSDCDKDWEEERKAMDCEIQQLKEENTQLETQLKFQAQVNAELKKLLVAAVGEDIETRVNHLTEDKVQLARALLSSAQRLSTHQEQTEWLAGQCEVWRSKFLASSLMVEELARWKAALSQKAIDLQETLQRLLEERCSIRSSLLASHRKLTTLRENFDMVSAVSGITSASRKDLVSSSCVDLASANERLCDVLTVQLLGSALERNTRVAPDYKGLEQYSPAEKTALQLLQQPIAALLEGGTGPDAACNAVMGAAMALAGSELFSQVPNLACCAHCSGEVHQVKKKLYRSEL